MAKHNNVNVEFLSSKLICGYNRWADREIDITSQSTNIHRISDSVFRFTEYNFLPINEQDVLDGHYTFFVNKDTFEYLVYKSSDYGSLTYVIPVGFDGFQTAETLPQVSKEIVESIIAHKLLTSYFYDSDAKFSKGKLLFEEAETAEHYHYIYSHRSLICDYRAYIWTELKPQTYDNVELQALNILCGFVPPAIPDFDRETIKSIMKGFKVDKIRHMEWNGIKSEIKYNELKINDNDYTVFFYKKPYGSYVECSLVEGSYNNLNKVVCSNSDTLPVPKFIEIIPTVLRNIAV
jgi:hypothetical protein